MSGQLSLFEFFAPKVTPEPPGPRRLQISGRIIEYRFRRSRRRTIGMVVDGEGLRVSAPNRTPWREVDRFIHDNESWIEKKLAKWASVKRGTLLHGVTGETLPLFGTPMVLEVRAGHRRVEPLEGRLIVSVSDPARRHLVIETLLKWLREYVLSALAPRVAHYTERLGLAAPQLAASNARRQWGTCTRSTRTQGGLIRLNWRLAHLPIELSDYVVAHEVSHLREMNHSRRFWALVEGLYPDWRNAREQLERAGAALPRLEVLR